MPSDISNWLQERGWEYSHVTIKRQRGVSVPETWWTHTRLNGGKFPWPSYLAARLSAEAAQGLKEAVHKLLRGEDVA